MTQTFLTLRFFPTTRYAIITSFFVHTWSGGFRGKLVQYIARHFEVVPGDTERPDHSVLRETERRQFRDVLDVDVLVRRRFRLGHSAATTSASSSAAAATAAAARIVPRPHQSRQSSSVCFQIDILHDVLIRAADHDRVFVMVLLTHDSLLSALRRPRCRQGRRHRRHVVARSPGRRRAGRVDATRLLRQRRRWLRLPLRGAARKIPVRSTRMTPRHRYRRRGRYRRHRRRRRRAMQHVVPCLCVNRNHCENFDLTFARR